jgi:hypothetical protein
MGTTRTMMAALLVGGCLLAACGDDDGASAPATTAAVTTAGSTAGSTGGSIVDDANFGDAGTCSLLTTDEVSAAMGKPVGEVEEDSYGTTTTCTWTSTAPPADPTASSAPSLMIAVLPLTEADQSVFDQLSAAVPPHRLVDGLGDFAILKCGFTTVDTCPWYSMIRRRRAVPAGGAQQFLHAGRLRGRRHREIVTAIGELVTSPLVSPPGYW